MKSNPRISRARAFSRHRRATARPRVEGRSFESLESRFLLSGQVFGPIAGGVPLNLPPDVSSQIPAGPWANLSSLGLPADPSTSRDDSYVMHAENGRPTVQIDLIWPEGPNPSDGQLLVSDASGQILYDLPLSGVNGIDAKLPIPAGSGDSSILEINIQITQPGLNSPTGLYRIAISWAKVSQPPVTPQPPSPLGTPASSALISTDPSPIVFGPLPPSPIVSGPDSPQSSLVSTRNLPTPLAPPTFPNPSGGAGWTASGVPVSASSVPGPSKLMAASPESAPASTPSAPASPAPLVPLAGLASPSPSGLISRSGVAGPLPLSGSTPDGGIFGYPYDASKGSTDPFRATLNIAPVPDPWEDLGNLAHVPTRRPRRDSGGGVPIDSRGERPSIVFPFAPGIAGSPLASGAAFLPPLDPSLEARIALTSVGPGASRWPILYSKIKPKTSLAALWFVSIGLFFGLTAPSCTAKLAELQIDRRWKRAVLVGKTKDQIEVV